MWALLGEPSPTLPHESKAKEGRAPGGAVPRFIPSSFICLEGAGPNSSSMGLNIRFTRTLLLEKMRKCSFMQVCGVPTKIFSRCVYHPSSQLDPCTTSCLQVAGPEWACGAEHTRQYLYHMAPRLLYPEYRSARGDPWVSPILSCTSPPSCSNV